MKRLSVILVVAVSLSAVAFTALWDRAHQDHIPTSAEIHSSEAAVCYAQTHGAPQPSNPIYLGNGKSEWIVCDVSGA